MKTLTIAHHIYLKAEEKETLIKGDPVEVIGVSIPVWFEKGDTSEPAKEVFCKYMLTTDDKDLPIVTTKEGYLINIKEKENLEFIEFAEGTFYGDFIKTKHYVYIKDISTLN